MMLKFKEMIFLTVCIFFLVTLFPISGFLGRQITHKRMITVRILLSASLPRQMVL
jgi:hypothetical protein